MLDCLELYRFLECLVVESVQPLPYEREPISLKEGHLVEVIRVSEEDGTLRVRKKRKRKKEIREKKEVKEEREEEAEDKAGDEDAEAREEEAGRAEDDGRRTGIEAKGAEEESHTADVARTPAAASLPKKEAKKINWEEEEKRESRRRKLRRAEAGGFVYQHAVDLNALEAKHAKIMEKILCRQFWGN